jgi:osmotically-inducible protein OsmY
MNRLSLTAALFLATLVAFSALAADPAINRTEQFRAAGAAVERLQVFEVSGIVIIRGRTTQRASAEDLSRIAKTLGYERVANLVQISTDDDELIARTAERELTAHHSLDGCQFKVSANQGVVSVAGRVRHELQKDVAMQLLRRIDGVRSVDASFTRF